MEGSCSLFDEYFSEEFQEEPLEGISERTTPEETDITLQDGDCDNNGNAGSCDQICEPSSDVVNVESCEHCEDENMVKILESEKEQSQDSAVLSLPVSEENSVASEPATPTTTHAYIRPRTLEFSPNPQLVNRMISTTSTTSDFDPFVNPEELPLPGTDQLVTSVENQSRFESNFGRSLLGGYSSHYLPDFALHGTKEIDKNEVIDELKVAVQHSVLDEHIAKAVCVVADTENWKVELLSNECAKSVNTERMRDIEVSVSTIVMDILVSVCKLWQLKMPPEFCVSHLEDRLQEVYFKSKALAEYLLVNRNTSTKELSAILGINPNDVGLLLSVTCVHSPWALNSLVNMPR
ncbi:folliculin-interacting protein 1-like [Ptychodera flava]|uniref:folliculin-interacting protein 1-like n=1 Tax=Ptychodera flava TaxID=63121 RepID=UPI00396A0E63